MLIISFAGMGLSKIKSIEELTLFIKSKISNSPIYNEIYEEICNDYALKTRNESPVIFFDSTKKIIYANSYCCDLLGYHRDQLIGHKINIILSIEDKSSLFTTNLNILTSNAKKQITGNYILLSRTGKTFPCSSIFFSQINNETEKIEFIKGVFIENQYINNDASFYKNFLQKYTSNSTTAFWIYNVTENFYNFLGNYEHILGYNANELPSSSELFFSLIHPKDVNKMIHISKPNSTLTSSGVDIRLKDKTEKYKWFKLKVLSISENNKGDKIIEGFIKNIDDYKRTQLKLYDKERQIILHEENNKKIFKSMPVGFIMYNANGDYIESNDEFLKLFNYTSKQEINKANLFDYNRSIENIIKNYRISTIIGYDPITRIIYSNYLTAPRTENIKYLKTKIISLIDKNDQQIDIIRSENEDEAIRNTYSAYIIAFSDKTSLIKTELSLKLDKSNLQKENKILENKVAEIESTTKKKLELLTNISDDIKSPLKSMSDLIELTYKSNNLEEAKTLIRYIRDNYSNVKETVNLIIDYIKINNNEITLKNDTINIDKLCREIIEINKRRSSKITHKYIESNLCKFKTIENEIYINQPIVIADKSKLFYILNKIISLLSPIKSIDCIEMYYNIAKSEHGNIIKYINQDIELDKYLSKNGSINLIEYNPNNLSVEFVIHFHYRGSKIHNENIISEFENVINTLSPIISLINGQIKYKTKEDKSIKVRLQIPYIKAEYLDSPWLKTKS